MCDKKIYFFNINSCGYLSECVKVDDAWYKCKVHVSIDLVC